GIIISAAFNAFSRVAGKLYAADLIGASAGALLVVLFLIMTGGEGTALVVGMIAAVSATIFSWIAKSVKNEIISFMVVAFAASLLFINFSYQIFAIPTDPPSTQQIPIHLH